MPCCATKSPAHNLIAVVGASSVILMAMIGFTQPGGDDAAPAQPVTQEPATVLVRLETTKGNIDIELNNEKAPISVANFLAYVDKGYYNGTIFHRVIPNFMIQGGGFDADMNQKPTDEPVKNEWKNGLSNTRGTIAMARLGRQPDSATSQFFINVADNAVLDQPRDGAGYAVFGKVVKGMDVVDAIKAVPTTSKGPHGDVPVEPIVINKVVRLTEEEG